MLYENLKQVRSELNNPSAVVCIIGIPYIKTDPIKNAILTLLEPLKSKDCKPTTAHIEQLLDYSKPKPTGIKVTDITPKTKADIKNIPNQLNALIDRYGGQHVCVILLKATINEMLKTMSESVTDQKAIHAELKNMIELLDTADETLNYNDSNPKINHIRKCCYFAMKYEPNCLSDDSYQLNRHYTGMFKASFIKPLMTRLTEWDDLYNSIIQLPEYIMYTNYKDAEKDPNIMLRSKHWHKTDMIKPIETIIEEQLIADGTIQYKNLWIQEISTYFRNKIKLDLTIPVHKIEKYRYNNTRLLPTKNGLITKQRTIFDDDAFVMRPNIKLIERHHEHNKHILNGFTSILGTEPSEKRLLAEIIHMCMLPGEQYGTFIIIKDSSEVKSYQFLENVLKALTHHKYYQIPVPTISNHELNETIGYPADATLILLSMPQNCRLNPGLHADKEICNHIYYTRSETVSDALLEDENVISPTLKHAPDLEDLDPIQAGSKAFLEDVLLWVYETLIETK